MLLLPVHQVLPLEVLQSGALSIYRQPPPLIIFFILNSSKRFLIEFSGDTFDCLCVRLVWKLSLKRLLSNALASSDFPEFPVICQHLTSIIRKFWQRATPSPSSD